MDEEATMPEEVKPPLLFWIVAGLSLLWNAFGAFDYIMTQTGDQAYLSNFPDEMIRFIEAFPQWVTAAWAVGVWGAVAGSILLLLRSRHAILAFAISLFGLAASTFYRFGLNEPALSVQMRPDTVTIAIWIVPVLLLLYSFRWRSEGVLR